MSLEQTNKQTNKSERHSSDIQPPPDCHSNVVVNWRWSGRNFNQISITYLPAVTGHKVRPNNWRFAVRLGQGSVALQQPLFQGTGKQFEHWPVIGPSDISSTFGHLMCSGVRLAHFTNPKPVSIDQQWPSGSGQKIADHPSIGNLSGKFSNIQKLQFYPKFLNI